MLASFGRRCFSITSCALKGHSKWQNIKATKGKNDMVKSQATNSLLRKARSAATRGGFDLKLNRELAGLEQEFRANGLSLDTFKNFLQKLKDKPDLEMKFDVIGPSGTFFVIEAEADSRKNFENTLRKYFNKVGGFRLAADSSAVRSWFNEKGVITLNPTRGGKELKLVEMEEEGIELDCEEVTAIDDDGKKFELVCDAKKLNAIEGELAKKGYSILSADVEFRPVHPVTLSSDDAAKVEKFYELIQEDENIQQIFDNIEPEQSAQAQAATA